MDPARVEQVVGLLSRHQEEIFRHILALLPHEADARDILQETCIAIYRKAEEYNPQRSFALWAFGFARMEVLKHRSRTQRKTILLSTELIEMLAQERESLQFQLHERLTALEQCVVALPAEDRD
ncbi:MAG: sigma factor, partial [Pirellulaceae bacterium]